MMPLSFYGRQGEDIVEEIVEGQCFTVNNSEMAVIGEGAVSPKERGYHPKKRYLPRRKIAGATFQKVQHYLVTGRQIQILTQIFQRQIIPIQSSPIKKRYRHLEKRLDTMRYVLIVPLILIVWMKLWELQLTY